MPTYDYQCKNCGGRFEVEQKITDELLSRCAICDGGPVERLITGGTFVLKGTGWYKTDYGSSGRSVSASPSKSASSSTKESSAAADSTKTESASSTASESKTSSSSEG